MSGTTKFTRGDFGKYCNARTERVTDSSSLSQVELNVPSSKPGGFVNLRGTMIQRKQSSFNAAACIFLCVPHLQCFSVVSVDS